jgi:hypothetical protein
MRTKLVHSRVHTVCTLPSKYRGGSLKGGIWSTRITVTLSIFNFSTRFFAQIVENRETQLSSLFLGSGDIFRKVITKTDLYGCCMASEILRFAHQIVRALFSAGATSPDLVFVITFRKIVPRT